MFTERDPIPARGEKELAARAAGFPFVTRLTIVHETRYDYERAVGFGPQRLLLRPRDSHALRVVEANLTLSPPGQTRWVYDAIGNCLCWFAPRGEARQLSVTSRLVIERYPAPLAPFRPDDPHTSTPIVYSGADRTVLNPFIEPATEDEAGVMVAWLHAHMGSPDESAVDFLLRLTRAIHADFAYQAREAQGVQAPHDTLRLQSGSCRDFAWLMVEALRRLGYAARFVTGYLHDPNQTARGAGATHAWCEVFLPDLGWMEFDPTNGIAESADLIPVAASRTPAEAAPVSGSVIGDPGRCQMTVHVEVTPAGVQAAA
ncbi:MAG TPA: transglutaminase family protein [Caulobacteraceae bacterium]